MTLARQERHKAGRYSAPKLMPPGEGAHRREPHKAECARINMGEYAQPNWPRCWPAANLHVPGCPLYSR